MTLQQIAYALAILETGSMNKAAEALFVSQPTLTSAMKELEQEIGIRIFQRTSRGMVQTKEGEDFLVYARQLYQQYELLLDKYGKSGQIKRKFGVSTQHYSFAVKAFVETVKHFDTLNYDFAIRETRTYNIIQDVSQFKSDIGILYLNDFNRNVLGKILRDNDLSFHPLITCSAYVYLWRGHPLAKQRSITFAQLMDYPCLSFEQGDNGSFYFAEEILSTNDYARTIKATDRATMLNLMIGLNGYTLCCGIICEELNGSEYVALPFQADAENPNSTMEIGYITKRQKILGEIGEMYIREVSRYLNNTKQSS